MRTHLEMKRRYILMTLQQLLVSRALKQRKSAGLHAQFSGQLLVALFQYVFTLIRKLLNN